MPPAHKTRGLKMVDSNSRLLKSVLKSLFGKPDVDADVHSVTGGGIQNK